MSNLTEEDRRKHAAHFVDRDRIKSLQDIRVRVRELIALAESNGFVVTIDTKPKQPLATGNFTMVADVRDARGYY